LRARPAYPKYGAYLNVADYERAYLAYLVAGAPELAAKLRAGSDYMSVRAMLARV
jgi:hypothetical protein